MPTGSLHMIILKLQLQPVLEMDPIFLSILSIRSYIERWFDIPLEEGILFVPVITSYGDLRGWQQKGGEGYIVYRKSLSYLSDPRTLLITLCDPASLSRMLPTRKL